MKNYTYSIPEYGLKAYALFFEKYGIKEEFGQSELNWIVKQSMKKKIFSLLLRSGWIKKHGKTKYTCINPKKVIRGLLEFKVPEIIKTAERPYAFTKLSAIEIWSDYSYVQRGIEKSPYFINILKKDLIYWEKFFGKYKISYYIKEGSTIGEYIILTPIEKLSFVEKDEHKVIGLKETIRLAKANEMYLYQYNYIKEKYGFVTD